LSNPVSRAERLRLQALFGLFGIGLMAVAPRSPDLKHNLHVTNGIYGFLVSLGAVGSVISLLVMGRLVHKIGVLRTLYASATVLYAVMASMPHIHTPYIYALVNILAAVSFSSHNIALHTQTLHRQEEAGEMLLPRMHGSWSIGVLVTVIVALLVTSRVSFAIHIDALVGIIWILTMVLIYSVRGTLIVKSSEPVSMEKLSFSRLRKVFTFDKSIILAFSLGSLIEFVSGDWATLVTNQEIKAAKGISILSYFALIVGMIGGRMFFIRLIRFRSERFWIRLAALAGGGGFIIFTQLSWFLAGKGSHLAISLEVLAFLFAGIGTSFMAPLFTTIANRRSSLKPSEVVSQLNLSNTIIIFFAKLIFAWIVQMTSITIALLLPGLLLMAVAKFAYLGNPHRLGTPKN
jgi:MFS family permease